MNSEVYLEEEVQRNPYNLKSWWNYIEFKKETDSNSSRSSLERFVVYERALKHLPRSYKLWKAYLDDRKSRLANKCITHKRYKLLLNTFERALVHMNKMPRIW